MPLVRPFRGLRYALDGFPDLTDVVCPPYDVITPAQQSALLARHERNAVRLELPADPDPHVAAAATLAAWRADGTLALSAEPSVHHYAHGTSQTPDELTAGVVARALFVNAADCDFGADALPANAAGFAAGVLLPHQP